MKLLGKNTGILLMVLALILSGTKPLEAQNLPEVLQEGTLQEQLDYIQNRTLIYENFRAIREDIFQKVKNNSLDSLKSARAQMLDLSMQINNLDSRIDSLSLLLTDTRSELDTAVENRDNISFVGIPMKKMAYNMLVWIIIGGLTILLLLGLFIYFRNRIIMVNTLNEIGELKEEFENYKKTSRERREKLVMDHFNEIKKFKEQMS
jgi:tetrahydromethanopterin S-methyltransferase subunit B